MNLSGLYRRSLLLVIASIAMLISGNVLADKIKVAGIYTQPIQQKWDARLHLALKAAEEAGEIDEPKVMAILARLEGLLQENDMEAQDLLDEIREKLWGGAE